MLKARKNLKRREIQEDTITVYYRRVSTFLRTHSRNVQIGLMALVVVLVVLMLMARSKRQAESTAASQLGIVENYLYMGQQEVAIPELENIAETFEGTIAAGQAVFHLAKIHHDKSDYENAELYYRQYLSQYKTDPLYTAAAMAGVAACYAHREMFEEAAQWYEKAWDRDTQGFNAAFYLENAAIHYKLAGNTEKSRWAYETIVKDYSQSTVAARAEYLMETL